MGTQTTWGAKLIAKHVGAPTTEKINASDMKLDGFIDDTFSEYRERCVIRTSLGGSISIAAPKTGLSYFGFVMFDSLTPEQVSISIDGITMGTAIVTGNNQKERLFTLTEPYEFKGGELIKLSTPAAQIEESNPQDRGPIREMTPYFSHWEKGGESYRIECIAFFKQLPPKNELPTEITHIYSETTGLNSQRITWITTWDAKCSLEYWESGSDNTKTAEENTPGSNHRIILTSLKPDTSYEYRIISSDRNGKLLTSEKNIFDTKIESAGLGKIDSSSVTLSVKNRFADSYNSTPTRSGIPFPQGMLMSSKQLKLTDEHGSEIPLQARSLGYWPDQSIKWVLLDFQTDTHSNSEHVYVLEYGNTVTRKNNDSGLSLTENDDEITVDTGRLNIIFDKTRFAPFSNISLDGNSYISGSRVMVYGTDGKKYLSTNASPECIVVEDSGPLHCVIRIEGNHESNDGSRLLKSIFRVHAFSNTPYIRLEHTFVNDNFEAPFTDIASMYIDVDTHEKTNQELDLIQTHDNRSIVNGIEGQDRLEGVLSTGQVNIEIIDFWQQYPKSLKSHQEGLRIGICPQIEGNRYSVGGEEEYKLYYYLKDGTYKFREGASKTHTINIGQNLPPKIMPMAQTPIDWNCQTKAFGEITSAEDGLFPDYENRAKEIFRDYFTDRVTDRDFGMMNFGDWYVPGSNGTWGNIEYDTAYVAFLQWARSGDMQLFDEASRASIHHRDVDTCHQAEDTLRIGGVYRHSVGHVGEYYPYADRSAPAVELDDDAFKKRSQTGGVPWGTFTISHTWIDGFLLHYFLTGDTRSIHTATIVSDRYASDHTRNYDFTNCRNNGWHLVLTMEMYKATGDKFYLNAAHIIFERTLDRQTVDGGWRRMLAFGHCVCETPPRHLGNAGFMIGILLVGLKFYHQVTKDPRVADSIVKGACYLVDVLWRGAGRGFQYTPCPDSTMRSEDMGQIIAGICYAWRISNDPRLKEVLLPATELMIDDMDPTGRLLSAQARVAPNILYDLQTLVSE